MSEKLVIVTEGLTKSYDGTTVVDHLNLRIAENVIFGLLGPNGAGKTTTILMLLGLTEPTAGVARVFGFDSTREPLKVKRLVGYLQESVGFYDDLTARENLRFMADLNNIARTEADSRINVLLEQVGLKNSADLAVGKFSHGMKQRLGIADVLIKKPKLVILDEPTSGLDPEGINDVLNIIASLPHSGATVVLCSHRLHEVQRVCDRIGIIADGKLVVEGSIAELSQSPAGETHFNIEVETANPTPQLIAAIEKVAGVVKAEINDNLILVGAKKDLRAEIAKVVVQNDFPLTKITIHETTLDDIYMRYFPEE